MYFDTYGPFELAREHGAIASRQPNLWSQVRAQSVSYDHKPLDLEQAIGCYAFGLRHGETYRPWYLGMTVAAGGFRSEILQSHKRAHYNAVIGERKGTPVLFLMPLLTPTDRFSRNRRQNKPLIEWVEQMLFGVALKINPDCRNQRGTKNFRNVAVYGVFNSRPAGRRGPFSKAVNEMFGN